MPRQNKSILERRGGDKFSEIGDKCSDVGCMTQKKVVIENLGVRQKENIDLLPCLRLVRNGCNIVEERKVACERSPEAFTKQLAVD